ncbi:BglG family transcription antiterminator [Heyndrickxia camelliae]|uniref:PTS fructose transporter subunit IIA n=1 Tax=Heyndrickxia camelliae TaxID=1707093 RepID=A0A2N3LHN9_9BACI|nr:BglG family transcription antiterminator [Heyndrickxia camelliae]PKR84126.1 PTS fructose transporter subunit IIA [Heyndrickxia camelliae]
MLNDRMSIILRELMTAGGLVTGTYLAHLNQVTSRTIREDIKYLDSILAAHGARIHSFRGKGYKLVIEDNQRFVKYLQANIEDNTSYGKDVPSSPEERILYIIKRLLLCETFIKLEDLADEMYISKSTIQNDLKDVKQRLEKYDIHIESRPNYGVKAIGNELKLRFCIAEYLFDRNKRSTELISDISFSPLPKEDLDKIQEIIMRQISENNIILSDVALHNLLIHIDIAYERIKTGNHVTLFKSEMKEIMQQREYEVARKIVNEVEEAFQVTFPLYETAYIAMHLLGTKILNQSSAGKKVVEQVIDDKIIDMVMVALDKIKLELNLDLKNDKELIIALSLHLKPAINRYKYGMNIRNPMLEAIKKNYPLAFEAGIVAGLAIEEQTGTKMNENEVGYLALHLGAAIERQKMKSGPKRCIIVCASGLGTAQLIYYKLKNQFGDILDVVGTTEYYNLKQYNLRDIDFVVSSIPISAELPVPVVEINAILGESDLAKIEKLLANQISVVEQYFRPELMFLGEDFISKEAVLEFLYIKLLKMGLVEPTFLEAVYERENVAPTAFGNLVAIPHPITPKSHQTFLTVCTLKKPIQWGEKLVQFICIINVKKNSQEDLQSMYELLGKIIDSSSIVQKLIKAKDYHEFIGNIR